MINKLMVQAVERETLKAMNSDLVFYPEDHLEQPLGKGTKKYTSYESFDLIHDLEEYSEFEVPFDRVSLISDNPDSSRIIQGSLINMIVPAGFQGEVYDKIGDYFTFCISTETSKVFDGFKYLPDTCQVKFKVRAAASFNKLPGFPKISGYKQMNMLGPSILGT